MSDPAISVVLPSYRGADTIGQCMDSLVLSLSKVSQSHEIVIVDSSDDETPDLIQRLIRDVPQARLIRAKARLTAGEARNRGLEEASGNVIAFVDQDCLVPMDWASKLMLSLESNGIDGVGGSIGISNPWNLPGATLYFLEFIGFYPRRSAKAKEPRFLLGCNAAYRRNVLRQVRFLPIHMGEDVILGAMIRASGYKTRYDPSIQIRHVNRKGWLTVFAYLRELGRASARYHRHLKLSRAKIVLRRPFLAFLIPLYVLPSILAQLVRGGNLTYAALFLALLPACLVGSYFWAGGFYRQATADSSIRS